MSAHRESVKIGERELVFETGDIARQASGAVLVSDGDTVVLAVVSTNAKPTHLPYMPLTVEYRHRMSAAGKIPGGYERREAKATTPEVLTSRAIDRSVRPFFPDTWRYDTQLIVTPLSYDPDADLAPLAITAAAAALNLSTVPWSVPLAGVRVARVDGALVAFPTAEQRERADLDMLVSASREGIVMLEGGGDEVPEDVVLEAFGLAQEAVLPLCDLIERLRAAAGKPERAADPAPEDLDLSARVDELAQAGLEAALEVPGKHDRYAAIDVVAKKTVELIEAETPPGDDSDLRVGLAKDALEALKKRLIRGGILDGRRLGGRGSDEIREISCRAGWLPRCHGSSLFTRGETQAIATCTLAEGRLGQRIESMNGMIEHTFLLHYNFPPYCVGEVRPLRGPARREIGHGFLARRALEPVLPDRESWPYAMRVESTVTESNGSSSMATVCGGSLAMLDAGVPLKRPVAGIAMGLVAEGERRVVLSDILGDEDHVGDMDFKVAGTSVGITAIQLDNKLGSLPMDVMREGLEQARVGRLHILAEMAKVLGEPRATLSRHSPRAATRKIEPVRIRALIGPGGRRINGIRDATGVEIDVSDDGTVRVFGPTDDAVREALTQVEDCTGLPRLGVTYAGRVVAVKHFGSFVRLFEGVEGLLPGVELTAGATINVLVSGINPKGKLELQRAGPVS